MNDKELTKLELQLMKILWKRNKGFVSDILGELPEPKPAYTTVSTIVRILVTKGFVDYEQIGKGHCYYPLISQEEYTNQFMRGVKNNFFGGSVSSLLSFFVKKEGLSETEREELQAILAESNKK